MSDFDIVLTRLYTSIPFLIVYYILARFQEYNLATVTCDFTLRQKIIMYILLVILVIMVNINISGLKSTLTA